VIVFLDELARQIVYLELNDVGFGDLNVNRCSKYSSCPVGVKRLWLGRRSG
jgi:hypothetical protein